MPNLEDILEKEQKGLVVPTGNPRLDPHIGGGFPVGGITSILARNPAAHRVTEVLLNGAVSRVNKGSELAILADIRDTDDPLPTIQSLLEALQLEGVELVVLLGFDALRTAQWSDNPGTQATYHRFVKVVKKISKEVRNRKLALVITDAGVRMPMQPNVLEGHSGDPCITHEMARVSDLIFEVTMRNVNVLKNRMGNSIKLSDVLQVWIDPKRRPSPQAQAGAKKRWTCGACHQENINNTMCWNCGQEYEPPEEGENWDEELWSEGEEEKDAWDSAP